MIKLCLLVLVSLSLYGCEKSTIKFSSIEKYTIIDINPPKRFKVTLKNTKGEVFKNVYVSKRCSRWKEVKVGSEVQLKTLIMQTGSGSRTEIDASSVCPR